MTRRSSAARGWELALAALAVVSLAGCSTAAALFTAAAEVDGLPVDFSGLTGSTQLTGHLYRPRVQAPAPAVVLLHGCGGVGALHHRWARTLRDWGYVALIVDSFGPRNETVICNRGFTVDPQHARMPDAYAAKAYLASQPYVNAGAIGLIGWSHGGWTALYVVDTVYLSRLAVQPFRAVIAFYPGCLPRLLQLNAPLLILIGEADDWTPAARCQRMVAHTHEWGGTPAYPLRLEVYPGAHHGFDGGLVPPRTVYGHTVGRHPEAAAHAELEVQRFLAAELAPR